ncbi:hypothetical protein N3K66_005444 [Trichothecium roseum]|uniref:Uncharacterized protein n=1 Tax=Trichothecium roseum TaxID=47278 RepID=A0ACC0UZ83_9HYPO|nr:hypothetical protein N3K66_005444 [Trichothecium roseum]
MFFFFTCGEKTFKKELPGYEGLTCQCHNCGNMSGRVLQRRPFFTFCFIPIVPFTISGYKDIVCHICHFNQPLEQRPDVQAMANGAAPAQRHNGGPPPQGQQQPSPHQGWGKQGPPPQQQQGQRYG